MTYKGHVNDEVLAEFADSLVDDNDVSMVRASNRQSGEVEARLMMPSSHWGLTSDIENLMKAMGIVIVDFSHASSDGITLYFQKR